MSRYLIEFLVGEERKRNYLEVEAPDELTALFRAGYEAGFAGIDGLNARVLSISRTS